MTSVNTNATKGKSRTSSLSEFSSCGTANKVSEVTSFRGAEQDANTDQFDVLLFRVGVKRELGKSNIREFGKRKSKFQLL